VNRGEIWRVGGGVHASKPRPALVIQDELYELEGSVTVIPFTSHVSDAPLFRTRISATEASGLHSDSDAMVDKVTTIKRQHATERIGRVSSGDLVAIERLLMAHLGIAR